MIAWHCAVTKPQQEHIAAVHLANQQFHTYLPVLDAKPMFPRYIFVEFDRDRDPWGVIRSTRGCCDLLKDGFIPAIVPQKAIEAIMAFKPPEIIPGELGQFTPGQRVRIMDGVLNGLEGLFQGDAKGRTACLLEICGRKVTVPKNTIRAA